MPYLLQDLNVISILVNIEKLLICAGFVDKRMWHPYQNLVSDGTFNQLLQRGVSSDQLYDTICKQVRDITYIWQTDELRRHKPTPVDEARVGLNIVEQSLWKAVPHYLHRVSNK
ncbi:phosphoenolpyruvate carboxylase 4-like [Rosa rugosa]|uniref:phosphoenolpyruvate carboxylase 4-like n=1 Tax=Rosa rugosa TaxID=74645 RepID=UPI002B415E3B|nr:phosphoenolpyruvate carboxylase 4-like [Rosa rugosa]